METTMNASPQTLPFRFHGKSGEYFRIWIVNLILSILTLGIYSAWAKVRTNRYFYGNTRLAGSGFEYHAKPITILKSRLIAVGLLLIYVFIGNMFPYAGIAFALALAPFLAVTAGACWLLSVVAVAVLAGSLQGYALSLAGLRRQVDPHWKRGMSFLRIGLAALQMAVAAAARLMDWLPIPLQELEPCIPSRRAKRQQAQVWFSRVDLPPRPAAHHTLQPPVA